MRLITEEQFPKYAEYSAMFFTNDCIIVNCLTSSPVMLFRAAIKKIRTKIEKVYLYKQMLFVVCQDPSISDMEFKSIFSLYPTKEFLRETNKSVQQEILPAIHWLSWDINFRYCSKCGGGLNKVQDLAEKKCGSCNMSFYPNLAPAVMVLIQRDEEVLLARSSYFKPGVYSALAGFVDIGESAESAAHREVQEEVGIEISQLKYFGSQSWPFPNSFMIAFKAQYLKGELRIDCNEIEDARWFSLDNLPELPSYPSISRSIIDSLLSER